MTRKGVVHNSRVSVLDLHHNLHPAGPEAYLHNRLDLGVDVHAEDLPMAADSSEAVARDLSQALNSDH